MKTYKTMLYALLLSLFMISCGAEESQNVEESNVETEEIITTTQEDDVINIAKDVDAEEFKALFESGKGILVDVRTPGEFAEGYIDGAINIDFRSNDFESKISELDKNVPIYVYCAAGGRSAKAMKQMSELGFGEVYNLLGGYGGWPYK